MGSKINPNPLPGRARDEFTLKHFKLFARTRLVCQTVLAKSRCCEPSLNCCKHFYYVREQNNEAHKLRRRSHESNANGQHADADPLIDLWVPPSKASNMVLQSLRGKGGRCQIQGVIFTRRIVKVHPRAYIARGGCLLRKGPCLW